MKLYMLVSKDFGDNFAFHAEDMEDAESKLLKWECYHGHQGHNLYSVREVPEGEEVHPERINDEYVN